MDGWPSDLQRVPRSIWFAYGEDARFREPSSCQRTLWIRLIFREFSDLTLGGNLGTVHIRPPHIRRTRVSPDRERVRGNMSVIDFATVEMRGYFLPRANSPNVSGCTVITSGPVIWPVMIGLLGTVS